VLDKDLIERIAGALGTRPGLIEKDWHVVRALGVLVTLRTSGHPAGLLGRHFVG